MGNGCFCSNLNKVPDYGNESFEEIKEEKIKKNNFNHLLKYFNETEKEIKLKNKEHYIKKVSTKEDNKNLKSFNTSFGESEGALILKRIFEVNKEPKKNGPKRRITIRLNDGFSKKMKKDKHTNEIYYFEFLNMIKEVTEENRRTNSIDGEKMNENKEDKNKNNNNKEDDTEKESNSGVVEKKMKKTESLMIMNKNPKKMFLFAQGKQSMTINNVLNKSYQYNSTLNSNKVSVGSMYSNNKKGEGGGKSKSNCKDSSYFPEIKSFILPKNKTKK